MTTTKNWIIDSHRGTFKQGLLENSIPAFYESYKEGANMLECDLRITKDEEIVLIHNRTIDHIVSFAENNFRLKGLVKNVKLSQLKALVFPNNAQILTLTEFLRFLKEKKIGAQIELKETGYEESIIQIIEEADLPYAELLGPVVLTSFNPLAALRCRKSLLNSKIPPFTYENTAGLGIGLQGIKLSPFYGKWVLKWCHKKGIWGFTTHYSNLPIKRIPLAHQYGIKFCPRVPDDEEIIQEYIAADVDGFETDNVPLIRRLIKEAGYTLPPLPQN